MVFTVSNKQKKSKLREKRDRLREKREELGRMREEERVEKLTQEGRFANGVELPDGAIAADLSEQAPYNSYSAPLLPYYIDQPFTCVDCGAEEIWTAEQQKWYFETAKGPVGATAIRCRPCRQKRNAEKESHRRRSGHSKDSM